jgi:hypothetical protein
MLHLLTGFGSALLAPARDALDIAEFESSLCLCSESKSYFSSFQLFLANLGLDLLDLRDPDLGMELMSAGLTGLVACSFS